MTKNIKVLIFIILCFSHIPISGICQISPSSTGCEPEYQFDGRKVFLSKKEWKQRLTKEQFRILRKGGTEPSFRNAYFDNTRPGIYLCAGCSLPLFSSVTKFKSGTGWPSFWDPICLGSVTVRKRFKILYWQHEVICSRCDGHLGDLFMDGPEPTGKRYCINSAALKFIQN